MLFCRRICNSDGSGVHFYLLVDVHEDAEDFEHGTSLDIRVTDGQSAWSLKGLYEVQMADQRGLAWAFRELPSFV